MIGGGGGNFVVESMVGRSEQSVAAVGPWDALVAKKYSTVHEVHGYYVARRDHRRMRPTSVLLGKANKRSSISSSAHGGHLNHHLGSEREAKCMWSVCGRTRTT